MFRFSEAYATQILDANDNAIVPASYGDVPLDRWAATPWEDRSVTSGPYRLSAVRPGQEVVLERDPSFWGAAPKIDRLILRVYPDAAGAVARLVDGEVDLVPKVPPLQSAAVAERDDLHLMTLPSLSYTYLGWNLLEPGAYGEDRADRGCGRGEPCRESEADLARLRRERPHPILADSRVRRAHGARNRPGRSGDRPVVGQRRGRQLTDRLPRCGPTIPQRRIRSIQSSRSVCSRPPAGRQRREARSGSEGGGVSSWR